MRGLWSDLLIVFLDTVPLIFSHNRGIMQGSPRPGRRQPSKASRGKREKDLGALEAGGCRKYSVNPSVVQPPSDAEAAPLHPHFYKGGNRDEEE